ncbi:MAG: Gfo/Idh/MocA family protein [Athalassotoga sp.]
MQKIAVIGAGMMGSTHLNCYRSITDLPISAKYVCDKIESKAQKAANLYDVKLSSLDEILNDPEISIVDICTPTFSHKDIVVQTAKHGKNVFCEKPIALSVKDAYEMVNTCETHKVKFMVGHVVRFFPEYLKIKEIVLREDISNPVMARFYRGGSFPAYGEDDWFDDLSKSGGVFVDLSIHDFDFARLIFGEVESVRAKSVKLSMDCKKNDFDHGMAILKFKNGSIVHVEGNWAEPEGSPLGFNTSYEIVGTDGMITNTSIDSATLRVQKSDGKRLLSYSNYNPTFINPYTQELRSFILSVEKDKPVAVNGYEAIKALEIALAANLSAKENRSVKLSEVGSW